MDAFWPCLCSVGVPVEYRVEFRCQSFIGPAEVILATVSISTVIKHLWEQRCCGQRVLMGLTRPVSAANINSRLSPTATAVTSQHTNGVRQGGATRHCCYKRKFNPRAIFVLVLLKFFTLCSC